MTTNRIIVSYSWPEGEVTVSRGGVIRLNDVVIGRIERLHSPLFSAWGYKDSKEVAIPSERVPETLISAVAIIYAWYVDMRSSSR